jgi:hypothetical protein
LALGITKEEALWLGKKYEQNAILWCDADFTPQLILLTLQVLIRKVIKMERI